MRFLGSLAVIVVVAAACSGDPTDLALPDATAAASPTPEATPTPTPVPNEPPVLVAPEEVRVVVGESTEPAIFATDPDGEIVSVGFDIDVPGLDPTTAVLLWQPDEPGTWEATYTAADDAGAEVSANIRFVSRYPAHRDTLIALGDSIASGRGLDNSDYLGRDDCWRAEEQAYPRLVFDALTGAGVFDPAIAQFAMVACQGADVAALSSDQVTGGLPDTAPDEGDTRTQLEWAVRANPAVVTITVGANDVSFVDPSRVIDEAGNIDQSFIDAEIESIRDGLTEVIDAVVRQTDARVVVTNYFNPAAQNPQGVDGCREACFTAISDSVTGAMNSAIAGAVARVAGSLSDTDRIRIADIRTPFIGHGAPNGVGPDNLREGGILGPVGDFVSDFLGGTQPYCARGETQGDPWINNIDCVHPNEAGTQAIAEAVVDALLG